MEFANATTESSFGIVRELKTRKEQAAESFMFKVEHCKKRKMTTVKFFIELMCVVGCWQRIIFRLEKKAYLKAQSVIMIMRFPSSGLSSSKVLALDTVDETDISTPKCQPSSPDFNSNSNSNSNSNQTETKSDSGSESKSSNSKSSSTKMSLKASSFNNDHVNFSLLESTMAQQNRSIALSETSMSHFSGSKIEIGMSHRWDTLLTRKSANDVKDFIGKDDVLNAIWSVGFEPTQKEFDVVEKEFTEHRRKNYGRKTEESDQSSYPRLVKLFSKYESKYEAVEEVSTHSLRRQLYETKLTEPPPTTVLTSLEVPRHNTKTRQLPISPLQDVFFQSSRSVSFSPNAAKSLDKVFSARLHPLRDKHPKSHHATLFRQRDCFLGHGCLVGPDPHRASENR